MFIHSSGTLWDLYVYIIAEVDFYVYLIKEFTALIIIISIYATSWYIQEYGVTVERGMKIMMEDERMNENNGKEPKDNKKNDEGLH
ncbi:hypothetical protein RhiirA1_451537 [Rhizophagus irregularis]|uniref:Uncharacterized protein n=2 Tax=Rhizophagus irregularis TaxID=588596 RepID=A0A2N0SC33_9GLOM|nr:hypothetical protein RhiirA1_451537 [Rhizophagus irregularis]GBC42564.2 hypothetical protein GLOIN_2v1880979 [Rhizophagus irregularis DAOM 181602=DAOM 197198]CAG8512666.1 11127_t:CDS:2 [Rhizophagus irregularis]